MSNFIDLDEREDFINAPYNHLHKSFGTFSDLIAM